MKKRILQMLLVGSILPSVAINAFAPTNFFRPTDQALRLSTPKETNFQIGTIAEVGNKSTGRNWDTKRRSILALHDDTQKAIPMFINAVGTTKTKISADQYKVHAAGLLLVDDTEKKRGHQKLTGNFKEMDFTIFGSYDLPFESIPGKLSVKVHVPISYKKISSVGIADQTRSDQTIQGPQMLDKATKKHITDSLVSNVKTWGNLDLSAWDKAGLGDVVMTLNWHNKYKQNKEYLKSVGLFMYTGFSFPTGKEKDEDKAFSMSLGQGDGAWGIPLGLGMDLDFIHNIKAGINVDFIGFFDKTRTRRMKTDEKQTEFLLLNKGEATKEAGLTWQFDLFLQAYHFIGGLSAKVDYQFVKHDDDKLSPKNNDFSYSTINTASSLKEWNIHNLIFSVGYDFFREARDMLIVPQIHAFYKLPVAGKNIVDNNTFGGQFAFNF